MKIEVKSLSKAFDKKLVLDDISISVNQGEMLCLLGPSGAGKTTLIRSIIGALKTDQGEIFIDGKQVPNRNIMYDIGFMPQEDALYKDLTGYGNLKFFGSLYGMKGKELKNRTLVLLKLMGLTKDKDITVYNYSGGMKKRLSLAIALLHNPKFLLLDEPTVGIDPLLRKSIWDKFYELKEQGCCLIISTHVMDEAEKCERVALIYDGKILYDDKTYNLIKKTKHGSLEELFFMAKEETI